MREKDESWVATTAGLVCFVLAAALALAACGGNPPPGSTYSNDGTIDYNTLSGEVRIDGSSTVFPISEAVAEEFSRVAVRVRANVAFSGTGGGFEKFCRGEIHVSDASRPMNDKERSACESRAITDIAEFKVAIDALTVVVNPANTWAQCLTTAQLRTTFQNGGPKRWNEIDPSWPDEAIRFYYPGADSGTFDYFKEALKIRGSANNEPAHRSDGTASEDDNVLVKGIEGDRYAIGYFGFAHYEEAGKKLRAISVDNGKGCVPPTFENALSGSYAPLSRPLYIYTRESLLKEKPALLGFLTFYLDNMAALSREVGYISLPDDLAAEQRDRLAKAIAQ